MSAKHVDGQLQYNTHNLYGLSEAAATQWALQEITGKRPFILTRWVIDGNSLVCVNWQVRAVV
jgi:alpha-glucosidase (family GH31 glycosyl hydrolase)